jgi:hypothetical protein
MLLKDRVCNNSPVLPRGLATKLKKEQNLQRGGITDKAVEVGNPNMQQGFASLVHVLVILDGHWEGHWSCPYREAW